MNSQSLFRKLKLDSRPEPVCLIYLGITLALLMASARQVYQFNDTLFFSDMIWLFLAVLICSVYEVMASKPVVFVAGFLIHFLVVCVVIMDLGCTFLPINFFFLFLLAFIAALRLPVNYSYPAGTLLFMLISTLNLRVCRNSHYAPILILFIGGFTVFLAMLIAYYRNKLNTSTQKNSEYLSSLDQLESVSESLLQHMTEIREESAEEERLRITRELHDSLGYSMTNIVMIMNAAQYLNAADLEEFKSYCARTSDLASDSMRETRETLYKLREISKDIPRNPSIFFSRMCREFEDATGIVTECHPGNFIKPVSERIFHTIYRAVQVGFINALKHGETRFIRLFFWQAVGELRITIWNNCIGDAYEKEIAEGIGLKGIRERLVHLNGHLVLDRNSEGFSMRIFIPD